MYFPVELDPDVLDAPSLSTMVDEVLERAHEAYAGREAELTPEVMRQVERSVMLQLIDNKWREHLADMDYLRAGIGLRAMGQRDPLSEYQREAYNMFADIIDGVKRDAVRYLYHVQLAKPETQPKHVEAPASQANQRVPVTVGDKVGRNDPCPCGSGKKFKKCCRQT